MLGMLPPEIILDRFVKAGSFPPGYVGKLDIERVNLRRFALFSKASSWKRMKLWEWRMPMLQAVSYTHQFISTFWIPRSRTRTLFRLMIIGSSF